MFGLETDNRLGGLTTGNAGMVILDIIESQRTANG